MMSDHHNEPMTAADLHAINHELSALLHASKARLASHSDAPLGDRLVICGILGGKDVGKSTLINALAGATVSVDAAEVGRGTDRPMVYVHQDARSEAERRLGNADQNAAPDITTHDRDVIRNVVLVDLPDFDSEFVDHMAVVREIAPLLDRILWVVSPRKVGDRAWLPMIHEVVKDSRNVHCVLNKVDELLDDAAWTTESCRPSAKDNGDCARTFWRDQQAWLADVIRPLPCEISDERIFLVAAGFPEVDAFVDRIGERWDDSGWQRFGEDRSAVTDIANLACADLDRLRSAVLAPVTKQEAATIKQANRDRQRSVDAERIRRHFEIDRVAHLLGEACGVDYWQTSLDASLGRDYCTSVADAMREQMRPDTDLADELLAGRVEHWPILRLVYWPFGWLSRLVGRRAAGGTARRILATTDPFEVGGERLVERIDALRSRWLGDHAVIAHRLRIESAVPTAGSLAERVATVGRRLPGRIEAELLDDIRDRDRGPSAVGRAFVWFVLLWFPLLQPVLAGGLKMFDETGSFSVVHGSLTIVTALSAAHLLTSLAVVVVVFVGILGAMYARALRSVRSALAQQADASPLVQGVDAIVVGEVVAPLTAPLRRVAESLSRMTACLDAESVTDHSDEPDLPGRSRAG